MEIGFGEQINKIYYKIIRRTIKLLTKFVL